MTTQSPLSQLIGLSPEQRRAVLDRMRQRGTGSRSIPRLADRAVGGASPTFFSQDRPWFLRQLAPGSTSHHVAWCYEMVGGLTTVPVASIEHAIELATAAARELFDLSARSLLRARA